MTSNFPYTNKYALLMTRKSLYNDECLSFAEMATRQSKDKYARLRSMKSEPLSFLAPNARGKNLVKESLKGLSLCCTSFISHHSSYHSF